MRQRLIILITIITSVFALYLFASSTDVNAIGQVGAVQGKVYMKYNGQNILLPGVGVYREDGNWDQRDYNNWKTCQQHVEDHMINSYNWDLLRYNCENEIPDSLCKDGCNRTNYCVNTYDCIDKPPGYENTVNYQPGDSDCKELCGKGKLCTVLTDVPPTKPTYPTQAQFDTNKKDICRADRGGVQVISQKGPGVLSNPPSSAESGELGLWRMGPSTSYSAYVNNPGPLLPLQPDGPGKDLWGSLLCPTGTMDNVSYRGNDESKLNRCGFNCLENPHKIKAFFPSGYSYIKDNFPQIKWDANDPKGGGSWKTRYDSGAFNFTTHFGDIITFTYADAHSNIGWDGYSPSEYYQFSVGNADNYTGFSFEWVPTNINKPPEFRKIDPKDPTPHIGTSTDADNGPTCSDKNPFSFKMTASDPDGSKDMDRIELSLAKPGQLYNGGQREWPLRVMFAQDFDGKANNTFFIRDIDADGTQKCFDKDGNLKPRDASTLYCYGVDNHNKRNGTFFSTTLNGVAVDVYYLNTDLTVNGGGYTASLKGGSQANWESNTYVAYQKNGNRVWSNFKIEFLGDENSKWTGRYINLWRVADLLGQEDTTADLYAGESILFTGTNHHRLGETKLDFKPPEVRFGLVTPNADGTLNVPWHAEDNPKDSRRSGLLEVLGEAKDTKTPPNMFPIISKTALGHSGVAKAPPLGTGYRPWVGGDYAVNTFAPNYLFHPTLGGANRYPASNKFNEIIDPLTNTELDIQFFAEAVDNACNMSSGSVPSNQFTSASPWLVTRAGLLYSAGILDLEPRSSGSGTPFCGGTCTFFNSYPFKFPQNQAALSSELLSVGDILQLPDNMVNSGVAKTYATPNYNDENNTLNGGDWYGSLFQKVSENSDKGRFYYVQNKALGNQAGGVNNLSFCSADKPCVVTTNALNITSNDFVCNREGFIFVNGPMTVSKKIRINDNTSKSNGCIFVVKGDVTINPIGSGGPDTEPNFDRLSVFLITNKNIIIPASSDDYGLQVWGSLLAFGKSGNSFTLQRSLQADENIDFPAYVIHHDPRYFEIARKVVFEDEEAYKVEIGDKN